MTAQSQKLTFWKTLQNGQVVKSNCYNHSQLCARFQIWSQQFGLTDSESVAAFIADDRARLAGHFHSIERGKQLAENAFLKLRNITFPEWMPETKQLEITFSEPDRYGEIHARLQLPLSIDDNEVYIYLRINRKPAEKYFLQYRDAGTVGYARMQGQYAISGKLTNVSADWTNEVPEFGRIKILD